jgi:hypothetical protein
LIAAKSLKTEAKAQNDAGPAISNGEKYIQKLWQITKGAGIEHLPGIFTLSAKRIHFALEAGSR